MNWVALRVLSCGMHFTEDLNNVYIKCPVCDPAGRRENHLGIHKSKPIYNCFRCGFKGRREADLRRLEKIIFGSSLAARFKQKEGVVQREEEIINCLRYDLYKDTRFDKVAINRLMKFFVEKKLRKEYFDILLELYKEMFATQQAALTPLKNLPDTYKDRLVFFSKERMWGAGRALSKDVFPKFKTELLPAAKELDWSIDIRGTYFPADSQFKTIFISEGPLDAFSMYVLSLLFKVKDAVFYSPGGVNLFRGSIDSISPEKRVVILTDRDQSLKFFKQLFYKAERDFYIMMSFFRWPLDVGKDAQDLLMLSKNSVKERLEDLFDEEHWIYVPKKDKRGKLLFYSLLSRALKQAKGR